MVKYLFFDLSRILKKETKKKFHFDTSNAAYYDIKYILKRYILKDKDGYNYNVFINELIKDKETLNQYNKLRYEKIKEYKVSDENKYDIIDRIENKIIKNIDEKTFNETYNYYDDLHKILNLKVYVFRGRNYEQFCLTLNQKAIDIIINIERNQHINTDFIKNIRLYYLTIQDEVNKYISIIIDESVNNSWFHDKYMNFSNINKNALLNDGIKQYLIVNHKKTNMSEGLEHYCRFKRYHTTILLLYFNYDEYFKDNFNQIINKYKNMFNMIDDLKTANIGFNFIKNNNDINQYVKYERFE